MPSEPTVDLKELLGAVEAPSPTQGVDTLATELGRMVSATEVSFLIVDIGGGTLVRLARAAQDGEAVREREPADTVPIDGSAPGMALRTQLVQIVPLADRDAAWVYAPATERGEAVGVLELLLPYRPDPEIVEYLAAAAHALAFIVIADRRYTDLYEWGSRSARLTLEAEIQRRLLPLSYTCEAGQFTLGGWLVPATAAGGDTFDFALDRDVLHLSITDAMGHGVDAALLATLGVGSLRNSRREGLPLTEHARQANDAVTEHARASPVSCSVSSSRPAGSRSSTPGTSRRCWSATASRPRSRCRRTSPSGSTLRRPTGCRSSPCCPATGWCC